MTDTITIGRDEYQRLLNAKQDLDDIRDSAAIAARIASGEETIPDEAMADYLAAPTPLAWWRKRRGLTQAKLAELVGVSQVFVAQMESGKRDGSIAVLARLARALDLKIDDLVDAA
jgi:DNA-binding XRE family transcriptional regulator